MRPIKVTMEGFTSFRRRTEVDFTGLDLFAITGPTGSGKTSIIDAMTYALYGRTPRMGAKNLSELITQGTSRMSVLFEFESGGKQYRIARVLKRAGAASVRLEAMEGAEAHPVDGGAHDISVAIAKIVGLDFDGFTKAVLLPQGQFDQFLRGKAEERRTILESLLNVGVYREMMQRANGRGKELQAERDLIKNQLEREYADATEENRRALASEIEKLAGEADSASAESNRVEELLSPALELRHRREAAANAERERETAEKKIAAEQKKDVVLAAEIQRRQDNIKRLDEQFQQVPYDEALHQKLIGLLPRAQQLEKGEEEHGAAIREKGVKSADLAKLEKLLESARQQQKNAAQNRSAAQQAYTKAKETFTALKEKRGSADMSDHMATELEQLGSLEQQLSRDQEDQARLEKQEKKLGSEIERFGREEATAKKAHSEAQDAVEALVRKHSAEELRKHLKAGEPCPVCDQVVGRVPKRLLASRRDEARSEASRCEEAWHKMRDAVAKATAELAGLPSQLKRLKDSVARTSKQITGLKTKAERILGKPPGPDAPNELKRFSAELRAAESDSTSKEDAARKAEEGETKAKDAMNQLERDRARLVQHLASLSHQIENAAQSITRLRVDLAGAGNVKTIEAGLNSQEQAKVRRAQITAELSREREARQAAETNRTGVANCIAGLKGQIESLTKALENAKSEAVRIEQKLKKKLAGLVLPEGADEAERIEKLLAELRRRAERFRGQLKDRQLRLEQLDIRIAEALKKRERIEELERSVQLYLQLGTLLRADQFIRFVLEGAFHLLCHEGSRQLLILSQGRYSLGTERDEFYVIDHWNADDRRSVRTLSGGESFLASLALALALAASVSQFGDGERPFGLDALFLDEGFSTLDAETLNVAIEALQALQQGDRMIAVISHVTDLAERLPSRIQVVKGVSESEIIMEYSRLA
jgi:exonuclease SbcC